MTTKAKKADMPHWSAEIAGRDVLGEPETTALRVVDNPEWSRKAAHERYRYLVVMMVDGEESDSEGFDDLEAAMGRAKAWAGEIAEDYEANPVELAAERRAEARDAVVEAASSLEGDDRLLLERVAELVNDGQGRQALIVLRAAGLAAPVFVISAE